MRRGKKRKDCFYMVGLGYLADGGRICKDKKYRRRFSGIDYWDYFF